MLLQKKPGNVSEATKDGITVDYALLIKVVLRLFQLSLLTWQLGKYKAGRYSRQWCIHDSYY